MAESPACAELTIPFGMDLLTTMDVSPATAENTAYWQYTGVQTTIKGFVTGTDDDSYLRED